MMIRSALSTTYWLVAPRWMIPLAAGRGFLERVNVRHHVVPQAFLPVGGRGRSRCRRASPPSAASASSLMRDSPSSRSHRASSSQSLRQSANLCCGENSRSISGLALRVARGDS